MSGLYLQDLIYIEDGNPDFVEGGLINWTKRERVAQVLQEIRLFQATPYNFQDIPSIHEYLKGCQVLDEDEAYKLSLEIETRAGVVKKPKKDKKPRSVVRSSSKEEPKLERSNSNPTNGEVEEDEEEFEITYSKGYKFYEKDSENNVILQPEEGGEVIIAGTIAKLVERATYPKYFGKN